MYRLFPQESKARAEKEFELRQMEDELDIAKAKASQLTKVDIVCLLFSGVWGLSDGVGPDPMGKRFLLSGFGSLRYVAIRSCCCVGLSLSISRICIKHILLFRSAFFF